MERKEFVPNIARIKVIGVGGGGCNAITRMYQEELRGVELIGVNTDAQALALTEAHVRFQIGERLTKGLGVGGDAEKGREAAEENRDELRELVKDSEMVFITAGMGGGTGTGAAPVIAELAKEEGALTIGIVTVPFNFEGARRRKVAEEGIKRMLERVDSLIVIPNDRLLDICDKNVLVENAFKEADNILKQAVQAISDLIAVPGIINLDFADVKAIMEGAGQAWLSIGKASGPNRAVEAARQALFNPLVDISIEGAKGVLFNVTGGISHTTLHEIDEAAELIRGIVDPEANIIFGVVFDPTMDNEIKITLIATGFSQRPKDGMKIDDDEIKKLLKDLEDEERLDNIPSIMRRPPKKRRAS